MARRPIAVPGLLLDIEGTTTPISFVTEVLVPYARQRGREYILEHLADEEIQAALRQLRAENASDRSHGAPAIEEDSHDVTDATIRYYLWLIDVDRKSTALKTIQGRIWEQGYAQEELRSMVFPDVGPALERWRKEGRVTAIYSSGSVLAQQQLFRHTRHGDLTPLIDAYFDTRVGAKKQPNSYIKIAETMNVSPAEILFVSDMASELDAALAAGMRTALSVRPGNPSQQQTIHPVIESFDELP